MLRPGQKSTELLQEIYGFDVGNLPEYHSVVNEIDGRRIICVRANETGEAGYNLCTASESLDWLWDAIPDKRTSIWRRACGLNRLGQPPNRGGYPSIRAELGDSIFPQEAELEQAISFEKGCYIGQEIVARMKYRGHPNRLLRGFEITGDTPPQSG